MFNQMNVSVSLISNENLSKTQIIKIINNNKTKDFLQNIPTLSKRAYSQQILKLRVVIKRKIAK